ncbi:MAG: hypothetical protein K8F56_08315 [Rhodocyclaceae bacterium]|jgi:hypothetical protein|nr:hypothetical protein [Rhodocyclaceae bacterium]
MLDAIFVALVILYTMFAAKVDEWITIAALGFKLETPPGFLQYPRAYDVIRSAFFLVAAGSLFWTRSIPWYIGLVVLAGAWLAAGWVGQRKAFATYRQIWREGIEDASTPDDRDWREAESMRTDQELRERVSSTRMRGT